MTDQEMFESLLQYDNVEQLHTATAGIVKQLGYDHFIYAVRVSIPLSQPFQFVFNGYPKEWWNRYSDAGYQRIDPVVRHSTKRAIPIIWDDKVFSTPEAAKLWSEAKDFGLKSGVTLPVHTPGCEWGLLSLASDIEAGRAREHICESLGKAHLMTCYLHEVINKLVVSNNVLPLKRIELSEREKECLLWAAEGKTSWEIANIIHISERTVIFHIQNASSKMGVSNRPHAVARALSMGLVSP